MPEPPERPKLALSGSQLAAAGLTTVTVTAASSYLGSYLGPGGTLVCAVAASVLSTAATAVWAHWLRLSGHRLKRINARRVPMSPLVLAGAALGLLAAVIGGITGVEAVTGRPLSALVDHSHSTGTTLGHVFAPPPAPSAAPATVAPTPTVSPTASTPVPVSPLPSDTQTFPIFSPTPAASLTPGPSATSTDTGTPTDAASPVPS